MIILVVIWRICLFIVAAVGSKLLIFRPRFPYAESLLIPSGLPDYVWSFANFDGVHYLTIATHGYWAQYTQVFFPLYPIFIHVLSFMSTSSPILSGLMISFMSLYIGLHIFSKLLLLDFNNEVSLWSIVFLLFFPWAFFFGAVYTESLFFLLIMASLFMARKQKWILAGAFGGLASFTRFTGIFLLPALLVEWWEASKLKSNPLAGGQKSKILWLALIPCGLLTYMIYLQAAFADAFYFWHAQPVFGAERTGSTLVLPIQVLWRYFKILSTVPIQQYDYWVALWEVVSFLLAIMLLVIAHKKKVRLSYLMFSWLSVIVPTLTGTFSSMPRYVLAAFPIFIILGLIKDNILKYTILCLSIILLIIFTVLFTRGYWVS